MRAGPVPTGWQDADSRIRGRWLLLPVFTGVALYGSQGLPQFLAGRWSGTGSAHTYWTDPWWIAGDAAFVGILAVALVTRRSRIRAGWSLFVALWAALIHLCVGSAGAAVQYSYGHAGIAFFYTLVVSLAIYWTFWIALALGLGCLGVAARRRTIHERRAIAARARRRQQSPWARASDCSAADAT